MTLALKLDGASNKPMQEHQYRYVTDYQSPFSIVKNYTEIVVSLSSPHIQWAIGYLKANA